MPVYLNTIATAVPEFDVHKKFVTFAPRFLEDGQSRKLFSRMAERAGIEHRYSYLKPHSNDNLLDQDGFYATGKFPDTRARMQLYERHALLLACKALDQIDLAGVTHLIVTSCTGFYAPGLDLQILRHYGLSPAVERTIVGFMGCYAAMNALKLARHIVRSDNNARVAVLNLELCTLHLQPSKRLEELLTFLIFADGCAAAIVSAEARGLRLDGFQTAVMPETGDQITWQIGESGFDMHLSGKVPATIGAGLPLQMRAMLGGQNRDEITHWAVHPGGRTVLDAVQKSAGLSDQQIAPSRSILRDYGNMSSATIMFVLDRIMRTGDAGNGCAMAFGPGLTVESMRFSLGSKAA